MKTPMHGLAERLQSEVDCLLDIIEARNATIAGLQGQLHEAHALTARTVLARLDAPDSNGSTAQDLIELRAELAEWRAHDCRNIARGFDGVSER